MVDEVGRKYLVKLKNMLIFGTFVHGLFRLNWWESVASLPFGCINGEMSACNGVLYYAGPAMYGGMKDCA